MYKLILNESDLQCSLCFSVKNIKCTYCSPVNEEGMKVHEHPSGLFGVGLLVEVSIEVTQLVTQD